MSDMTLVLRIKADGTAEVVGAAKAVEGALAGVGTAGQNAGEKAKVAADEAALAQARLARVVEQTHTPVERLTKDLHELEALRPFARTGEEAVALERALARTRAGLAAATAAGDGVARSSGLAAHQINNLGYQLSDVAAQLGSGTNPLTILMQQGPQVVDALGGVTSAAGMMTLGILAAGAATVAPFALLSARAMAADAHIRTVTVALAATGQASRGLAADIEALTDRTAQSPFFDRAAAEQAVQGLARIRQVSAQLRAEVLALAPDLGAALGKDAATAALELGEALAHPTEGARRLDAALGHLTQAQLDAIESMERQGNRAGAQQVLFDALKDRVKGLADQGITPTAKATKEFGDAWDRLMTGLSRSTIIAGAVNAMTGLVDTLRKGVGLINEWAAPGLRTQKQTLIGEEQKIQQEIARKWASLTPDRKAIEELEGRLAKVRAQMRDIDAQLPPTPGVAQPAPAGPKAGGTGSGVAPQPDSADIIKRATEATRELLPVERQRAELKDTIILLEKAERIEANPERKRDYARALDEARASLDALLTPQERALEASRNEAKLAQMGRLERVKLTAQIQAETEARDDHMNEAQKEEHVRNRVNAAVRMASEGYAENTRQLSLAAQGGLALVDAYAQGEAAALRQAAANEAAAQALSQYGVNVAELTQRLLDQKAADAAGNFAGEVKQYERQVSGIKAVAAAQKDGVAAVQEAQREQKVLEATAALRAAAEASGNEQVVKTVDDLIARYRQLSKDEADGNRLNILEEALRQQREGISLAQTELHLVGKTEEERRLELARIKAINDLKAKGIDLEKVTNAEVRARHQKYVDQAVELERANIKLDKAKEAEQERVRIAQKATDDIVEYSATKLDEMMQGTRGGWRAMWNDLKAIARRTIATIAAEAIFRPIIAPMVYSVLGAPMPANAGAPQGVGALFGGGGVTGQIGSFGLSKAGGWLMDKLGLGTSSGGVGLIDTIGMKLGFGAPTLTSSALAAGYVAPTVMVDGVAVPVSAEVAAQQLAMLNASNAGTAGTLGAGASSGGLASLSAYLGVAGAGALGGGLIGGWLGTRTNSKAVGGLSGAAAGAGAGYLATVMGLSSLGGPVGAAIGAVVGAIMGMLGTAKKSVGPMGGGNFRVENGRAVAGDYATDNGMDAENARKMAEGAAATFQGFLDVSGGKLSESYRGQDSRISYFQQGDRWLSMVAGVEKEFKSMEEALVDMVRRSAEHYEKNALLTIENGDVKTAIANSKAKDPEQFLKDVAFGRTFRDTIDALNNNVGIEDPARKAGKEQADALAKQIDEFHEATARLGLDTAAAAAATRKFVDNIVSGFEPKTYTEIEAAVVSLKAQWESMAPVLMAVGYTAEQAGEKVREGLAANLKRMQDDYLKGFDARYLAAEGKDYITQARAVAEQETYDRRNLTALGLDPDKAVALANAEGRKLFAGLTSGQLEEAARLLTGTLSGLAKSMAETARASELEDHRLRLAEVSASAGRGPVVDLERYRLEAQQRRDLAEATDDTTRARLREVHALQREALELDQTRRRRDADLSLASRAYNAAGRIYRGGLIDFDQRAWGEMAQTIASGGDVRLLGATQGVERGRTEIQLIVQTIDQQIQALQANTQSARENTARVDDLRRSFRDTASSFRIDASVSPLSPGEMLAEARRQFEEAVKAYQGGDLEAGDRVVELGRRRLEAAKVMYASSDRSDYDRVTAILEQLGNPAAGVEDTNRKLVEQADRQIAELQRLREQAVRALDGQTRSMDGLGDLLSGAIGRLQSSMDTLARVMPVGPNPAGGSEAMSAVFGAEADNHFGGRESLPGVSANRFIQLARAAGYTGPVGNGELTRLRDSDAVFRARHDQLVDMYLRAQGAGLSNLTGFSTGGSFRVGGAAGIDGRVVAIRATAGEIIDVRRPYDPVRSGDPAIAAELRATRAELAAMRRELVEVARRHIAVDAEIGDTAQATLEDVARTQRALAEEARRVAA